MVKGLWIDNHWPSPPPHYHLDCDSDRIGSISVKLYASAVSTGRRRSKHLIFDTRCLRIVALALRRLLVVGSPYDLIAGHGSFIYLLHRLLICAADHRFLSVFFAMHNPLPVRSNWFNYQLSGTYYYQTFPQKNIRKSKSLFFKKQSIVINHSKTPNQS